MSRSRLSKRPGLKRTYNADEAAVLLDVDVATVYRMCRDGRLRWRPGVCGRRVVGADVWRVLRLGEVDRAQMTRRASPAHAKDDDDGREDASAAASAVRTAAAFPVAEARDAATL